MPILRVIRIVGIAALLPVLYDLSQATARARGNEPVPGLLSAIGALTVIFLLRAIATEWSRGPEMNLQKDLLWGLMAGGVLTIVSQLVWGA